MTASQELGLCARKASQGIRSARSTSRRWKASLKATRRQPPINPERGRCCQWVSEVWRGANWDPGKEEAASWRKWTNDPSMNPPWVTATMVRPSWARERRSSAPATRLMNPLQLSPPGQRGRSGSRSKSGMPKRAMASSKERPSASPGSISWISSSITIGRPSAGATISAVWRARGRGLATSTSARISPVPESRSRRRSAWTTPRAVSPVSPRRPPTTRRTLISASPWRMRWRLVMGARLNGRGSGRGAAGRHRRASSPPEDSGARAGARGALSRVRG